MLLFDHDVFSATGTSNGVDRNGKTFDVTINSPVIKRTIYPYMESGILSITPEGRSARTVNYGDGTWDNKATLTINGNIFTFTLY